MAHPFLRTMIRRAELASTNDHARELLIGDHAGELPLPLLVRADRQTAGRGRGANTWWSDAGSLTFTIALDPAAHGLTTLHEPRLALASATALIDAVAPYVPLDQFLGIRWPNDVELSGRKLAGILPERLDHPQGPRLLIGVGINLRTRLENAPGPIQALAATLVDSPATPDLDTALGRFLDHFAAVLPRLASDDPALAARWAELDDLRDQPVRISLGNREIQGRGMGVDPDGALVVANETGTVRVFGGRVHRG